MATTKTPSRRRSAPAQDTPATTEAAVPAPAADAPAAKPTRPAAKKAAPGAAAKSAPKPAAKKSVAEKPAAKQRATSAEGSAAPQKASRSAAVAATSGDPAGADAPSATPRKPAGQASRKTAAVKTKAAEAAALPAVADVGSAAAAPAPAPAPSAKRRRAEPAPAPAPAEAVPEASATPAAPAPAPRSRRQRPQAATAPAPVAADASAPAAERSAAEVHEVPAAAEAVTAAAAAGGQPAALASDGETGATPTAADAAPQGGRRSRGAGRKTSRAEATPAARDVPQAAAGEPSPAVQAEQALAPDDSVAAATDEADASDAVATPALAEQPEGAASGRSGRARRGRRRGGREAPGAPAEAAVAALPPAGLDGETAERASSAPEATAPAAHAPGATAPAVDAPAAPTEPAPIAEADAAANVAPPPPRPARARPPVQPGQPSRWQRSDGERWRLRWLPGDAPEALHEAVERVLEADGTLAPEAADALLPATQRLAAEAGHRLEIDPAVWPVLAADRDRRTRAAWLAALYPDGPASPALTGLLSVPLVPFQAEGALWSVVAGRALLADEPGLGKGVQAIAAARLWQRHFGVDRVLVLCAPAQRSAWQQAWWRLAGITAQVMPGTLLQRSGQWAQPAGVRILSPEALASDAAALAGWDPQLVVVDEPQRLGLDAAAWAALAEVPQALVLSGAALDAVPDLLGHLVDWLDPQRLGPYAAWCSLRAARDAGTPLDEAALEAVSDALSRVLLQRQRADLADQLPPVVQATRWIALGEAQRAAHEAALARAERLVAGWQRSAYLADADQWRLSETVLALQAAAYRADPARPDSPLSEAVLQALAGQLDDWAESGEQPVWLRCDSAADAAQLGAWLADRQGPRPGVQVLAPGQRPEGQAGRVLQVGAPWRLRREPLAGDGQPAQHWVAIVAEDSLEQGLLDTLATRGPAPRGPAEPGSRGFLTGERLADWLAALAAALQALRATRAAFAAG